MPEFTSEIADIIDVSLVSVEAATEYYRALKRAYIGVLSGYPNAIVKHSILWCLARFGAPIRHSGERHGTSAKLQVTEH